MNAQIQAQLDRVDAALNTLVDSIASYNPSPAAAHTLIDADEGFSKLLEELATHQASFNTLLQLQDTAEALDDRIKSNLTLLADTRKELLTSTPITLQTNTARPVPYEDVLGYARSLARFTIPPTYRPPLPPAIEDDQSIKQEDATPRPGSVATAGGLGSARAEPRSHLQELAGNSTSYNNKAMADLPEPQKAYVEYGTDEDWTPWPKERTIRGGALARIQAEVDQGSVDPAAMNLKAQAEASASAGDEV